MDVVYTVLSRYTQPLIIVLGTIGALCNQMLFFSRKQLRSTSCSVYFRVLSLNDLLVLYIVILPQWLRDQFAIDPEREYNWYCKLSTYLTFTLYTLSPYILVLACFDRLCTSSTHPRLRQIASHRGASFLIPSMMVIVFVVYSHIFVGYQRSIFSNRPICTVTNYSYYIIFARALLVFFCFLPPLLMLLFCGLTVFFLRRHRRRIMPVNQQHQRQRDGQLLKMLFIYVISNIVCFVPFSMTFFLTVSRLVNSSALSNALTSLFILWVNTNYCTSFYLYTLGTPLYRSELLSLIRISWQRIRRIDQN